MTQFQATAAATMAVTWPWRLSLPCDLDLWPSDLIFLAPLAAANGYVYANFSVDSSSRFPFRVQTDTRTDRHRQKPQT